MYLKEVAFVSCQPLLSQEEEQAEEVGGFAAQDAEGFGG